MSDEQARGEDLPRNALKRFQSMIMNLAGEDTPDKRHLAVELEKIYQDLEECWTHVDEEGQVPTVAQGISLARFMRPHFQDTSRASAFVTRGGGGLGSSYLHVRLNDGYEGGIDKKGRTST